MTTVLNEIEAAKFLKLSRSFLRQARMKGTGPIFCKAGRAIRYRLSDLELWLESRSRINTIQLRKGA